MRVEWVAGMVQRFLGVARLIEDEDDEEDENEEPLWGERMLTSRF